MEAGPFGSTGEKVQGRMVLVPRISTTYLTADGHYRIRQSHTTPTFPLLALNSRDRQAHTRLGSPTFVKQVPVKCDSLDDLLTLRPPLANRSGDTSIVCEENNFYPIALEPMSPEAHMYHQATIAEEAMQVATDGSTHDEYATPLNQTAFWVVLGIVTLLTFILGFMLVSVIIDSRAAA